MLGITTTNARVGGFRGGISAEAKTIYNRIIADGGVSNLSRLNFFVKGLKAIYGDLANVPVCYDAHWIGYKLGSGTGATAGQAAAKLYSLTVAGDAVQATAASQPLLLAHNGASSDNYWWGSGVTSNCITTPNAAANRIIGDIEIIANISMANNSSQIFLVSKDSGSGPYSYYISNTNLLKLTFFLASNPSLSITVTSTIAISSNFEGYLKVSRNATNGDCIFSTSSNGTTYTQLGTTISSTSGALVSTNDALAIGAYSAIFQNSAFRGKIYRATISNSIGGAPVVDFNPSQYNASTSQTAWTSATGEVWTINTGVANTGYKGVLVDRTIVQGDGVNDTMASSTLASRQYFTSYSSARIFNYLISSEKPVYSGSSSSHILYSVVSLNGFNGVNIISGNTSILLNAQTLDFNSISSKIRINAGSDVLGSTGVQTSTDCKLFVYGGTVFGNVILNTLIQPNSLDSDTTKTATYNLIRSLNNNAF